MQELRCTPQQFLFSIKTYQREQWDVQINVNNTSTSTGKMYNNMVSFSATQQGWEQ